LGLVKVCSIVSFGFGRWLTFCCQTTAALEEASKEPGAVVGRISTDEKSDGKEFPESPVVQRVITGNE